MKRQTGWKDEQTLFHRAPPGVQKKMMSDLNISHGKMPDFVSCPLLGFNLVMKLRNFDFESQWNTLICFDKKRCVWFKYVQWKNVWFCFISSVWFHFSHKTEKFQFWKSLKYFNVLIKKYMMSNLNMSHGTMWFCFISIVWVHFRYKTEKFSFWKPLKDLICFDRKDMVSDLKISRGKMSDFVSLFGFTLVIKLRNFDFGCHWNIYFNIFW